MIFEKRRMHGCHVLVCTGYKSGPVHVQLQVSSVPHSRIPRWIYPENPNTPTDCLRIAGKPPYPCGLPGNTPYPCGLPAVGTCGVSTGWSFRNACLAGCVGWGACLSASEPIHWTASLAVDPRSIAICRIRAQGLGRRT